MGRLKAFKTSRRCCDVDLKMMPSKCSSWRQLIHMTVGLSLNYSSTCRNSRYSLCCCVDLSETLQLCSVLVWLVAFRFWETFDTPPGHWESKHVRTIKSSIHAGWPVITGIFSRLSPLQLAFGCRWQRGKLPPSFSQALGLCVSSDTVIVRQLKSEQERVGMGVGGH